MDIATLCTLVISLISPYVQKAAEKLAEEQGKRIPDYIGKLYSTIKSRFARRRLAKKALTDFVRRPQDADLQKALEVQLKKLLVEDPKFAAEIGRLVSDIHEIDKDGILLQTQSGGLATFGSVAAGKGGVAIGKNAKGDIHINNS